MAQQIFIRIKYLDTEGLFNPYCKCLILLECIRKKCDLPEDVRVDLIDEKGRLATLSENPNEYASTFLKNRRTYILIKVTKPTTPEGQEYLAYEALLEDIEEHYPDLPEKLKVLSQPAKTPLAKHLTTTSRKRQSNAPSSPKQSKDRLGVSRARLGR